MILVNGESKIVGVVEDNLKITAEGVTLLDNSCYLKHSHTNAQKKLIKEMDMYRLNGNIIEVGGVNVKYVTTQDGRCEKCMFKDSKGTDWDMTTKACLNKCKAGYYFN